MTPRRWFVCYTEVRIPPDAAPHVRQVAVCNSVVEDHPILALRRWQLLADEREPREGRVKYALNWFTELIPEDVAACIAATPHSVEDCEIHVITSVTADR